MKEQLISFETAKLAKEKGFDWKVTSHYRDGHMYDKELITGGAKYNMNDPEEQVLWRPNLYSAPTQSLLQKWLREVYRISIEPNNEIPDIDKDDRDWWSVSICYVSNGIAANVEDLFNSYEEALEAGLFESLKLINH